MYTKMIVPVLAVILAVASAGLVGGPMDIDMTDQGAQEALQYAVVQYNRGSNDAYVRQVSNVISVKRQVSASFVYLFYPFNAWIRRSFFNNNFDCHDDWIIKRIIALTNITQSFTKLTIILVIKL